MPAAVGLPYRSNIDKISEFVFNTKDPSFKARLRVREYCLQDTIWTRF